VLQKVWEDLPSGQERLVYFLISIFEPNMVIPDREHRHMTEHDITGRKWSVFISEILSDLCVRLKTRHQNSWVRIRRYPGRSQPNH
jgi:hypothetical protein